MFFALLNSGLIGKRQKAEEHERELEEERVESVWLHKKGNEKARKKQFKLPLINKTWSS